VQGVSNAWFDLFIYRDAFSPILTECPANQSGTSKASGIAGINVLDNIHPNDWALYAGVEFGDSKYYGKPDSVEFTASTLTTGGTIEVWLDSIDTGTKISECKITATGSWNDFRPFRAAVLPVTGIHDVYLKFTGTGTSKLFQLKWMVFTRKPDITGTSKLYRKPGDILIYPNPATTYLTIQSGFLFHTTEIFNIKGQRVWLNSTGKSECCTLNLNLARGMYFLKVSNENNFACSRLMID
jgi:xylan 1,4-beta-xylosidase